VLPRLLLLFAFLAPLQAQQIWSRLTNPDVEVTLNHPPGLGLQVDRIAFKPMRGKCSDEFTNVLIEDFVQAGMTVIDRQRINAVLDELDLGASGYIDSATAAKIGSLIGPSALVFVNVHRCAAEQNRSHKTTKTKDGSYTTYYATTTGFFKGSLQVVDLSTGKIFTAKTVEGQRQLQNYSNDGYPEYPSSFEAIDQAMGQGRVQVSRLFFPWTERRQLVFFDNKKYGFKDAYQRLKIGDVEGALELSHASLEACENDPKAKAKYQYRAYYNVGILYFIQGEHQNALDFLDKAYRIKSVAIVKQALMECRRAMALEEEMRRSEERTEIAQAGFEPQAAAPPPARSVEPAQGEESLDNLEARLAKLKSLYEKGLITLEDYEKKKAEILAAM